MSLCAVIGHGPVGRYVAVELRKVRPDTRLIGLDGLQNWLSALDPDARFLRTVSFEEYLAAAHDYAPSEILFAGKGLFEFRMDRLTVQYLFRQHSFWNPQSYLRALEAMFADNGISVVSPLQYLSGLRVEIGLRSGNCGGYDAYNDFVAASVHLRRQPRRLVRQACIVDGGRVIMSEVRASTPSETDYLIKAFGKSDFRMSVRFPVLCKLAVPPFERLDVPTIGLTTAQLCAENGVKGILIEANKTIIMDRTEVLNFANQGSICLCAVEKFVRHD